MVTTNPTTDLVLSDESPVPLPVLFGQPIARLFLGVGPVHEPIRDQACAPMNPGQGRNVVRDNMPVTDLHVMHPEAARPTILL